MEKERKKNKSEKRKEERGVADGDNSKDINGTRDTSSKLLKEGKKRKSKDGSSSDIVVYDIRSDNEDNTDAVEVLPTQASTPSIRPVRRMTCLEDIFYRTKEADPWDSHTPGIGAPSDETTSKKKKRIDGEGSTRRKKTSHPAKKVQSSSDSDSSEDDFDGVVFRN